MIVIFERRPGYILMRPHGDQPDPWWLSSGALEYLREYTDYSPYKCEHISQYLIDLFTASGDLRPLAKAPKLGTLVSKIPRVAACGSSETGRVDDANVDERDEK